MCSQTFESLCDHVMCTLGAVSGLGSLCSQLHNYEPHNYTFARVLESGYLHSICKGFADKRVSVGYTPRQRLIMKKLLLVLCHIFVKHPIPSGYNPWFCREVDDQTHTSVRAIPKSSEYL